MGNTRTVIRASVICCAFFSPFVFPIGVTFVLVFLGSLVTAWVPLSIGLLLDALYWSSSISSYPVYTLFGVLGTCSALWAHRYIETSIMKL